MEIQSFFHSIKRATVLAFASNSTTMFQNIGKGSILAAVKNRMSRVHQAAKFGRKFIDYKIGLAGAIVMGGIVFAINYYSTHQLTGSITASLKQGTYTFIFGGTLMKVCEYIATNVGRRTWAIVLSVAIPSVFTLILTFTMHNLKGTPKPFESTIPTTIIIPATAVWGFKKRKKMEILSQMKN